MGVSMSRQRLRENSTLSAEVMQIVQDYRDAFWPDSHLRTADVQRLVSFLASSVEDVPQTKPVLKEALAQQIRANHSEDAEWLLSRYGVDLGIQNPTSAAATPGARRYRVDEIVQSVDPKSFTNYCSASSGLNSVGRRRPDRCLRAAASVYQTIPLERRPQRLVSGLRSLRRRLRRVGDGSNAFGRDHAEGRVVDDQSPNRLDSDSRNASTIALSWSTSSSEFRLTSPASRPLTV